MLYLFTHSELSAQSEPPSSFIIIVNVGEQNKFCGVVFVKMDAVSVLKLPPEASPEHLRRKFELPYGDGDIIGQIGKEYASVELDWLKSTMVVITTNKLKVTRSSTRVKPRLGFRL